MIASVNDGVRFAQTDRQTDRQTDLILEKNYLLKFKTHVSFADAWVIFFAKGDLE